MEGWIVAFQLPPKASPADRVRFNHEFWGRTTSSWGGKYHYRIPGLMQDVPHRRLVRGVFLLRLEDRDRVTAFLNRWKAEYHVRRVHLEREDLGSLKGSS